MDARTANQMQMLAFVGSAAIAFKCECGDPACTRTVPLAPDAYHHIRVAGELVLHPGHAPVEDDPLAAERLWVTAEEGLIRRTAEALKVV